MQTNPAATAKYFNQRAFLSFANARKGWRMGDSRLAADGQDQVEIFSLTISLPNQCSLPLVFP
jgi:hypothetical protein